MSLNLSKGHPLNSTPTLTRVKVRTCNVDPEPAVIQMFDRLQRTGRVEPLADKTHLTSGATLQTPGVITPSGKI